MDKSRTIPFRPAWPSSSIPTACQRCKARSQEIDPPQNKRHFTECFCYPVFIRGTIAKGAFIGFLTGLGYSSAEIERRMADGTSAATVRRQWKNWGLPLEEVGGPKHRRVAVNLTFYERAKLARQAKKRGLTGAEYLRRINVCAIRDDMYDAITDGEFD